MTHRWRILPDDGPRATIPALWCLFEAPLLFLALIVACSILYGVYWKRRFLHVSHEARKC